MVFAVVNSKVLTTPLHSQGLILKKNFIWIVMPRWPKGLAGIQVRQPPAVVELRAVDAGSNPALGFNG